MPKRKSDMSVDLGFEDVDSLNVRECLESHSQPFTDIDLTELGQPHIYDEKEETASEGDGCFKGNFDKKTRADISKFGNC
jgi:hypothetical protein